MGPPRAGRRNSETESPAGCRRGVPAASGGAWPGDRAQVAVPGFTRHCPESLLMGCNVFGVTRLRLGIRPLWELLVIA